MASSLSKLFRKLSFCDEVVRPKKVVLCKDSIFRRKTNQLWFCMEIGIKSKFSLRFICVCMFDIYEEVGFILLDECKATLLSQFERDCISLLAHYLGFCRENFFNGYLFVENAVIKQITQRKDGL